MKPKFYFDEIFSQNFWFFLGWKPADVEKFMRKKGWSFETMALEKSAGKCVHFHDGKREIVVIWLKEKPKGRPFWLGVLAHEAVHAVNCTFDYRGVKPDLINDETQAYFTGCIVRKALE